MTLIRPAAMDIETKAPRTWIATAFWTIVAIELPVDRFFLADTPFSTYFGRIVLAVLVISVLFRKVSVPAYPAVWLSALVFLPLAGVLSGRGAGLQESVTVAVQLALLTALAPFVLKYYSESGRHFLRWVVGGFLASQTLSAALGLYQLTGADVFGATLIFGRSTGIAGHPNVLGIMSAIAIFGCLAAWAAAGRALRGLLVPVVIVNAAALVSTGSLSSMLAAFVGLLVFLIIKRRVTLVFVALILGAAFIAFAGALLGFESSELLSPIQGRIDVVTGTSTTDGGAASINTRFMTYEWGWRYITDNPLIGVGMDNARAGTYNGITPVHNFILHAWYQGGLFFFIWIVAATIAVIVLIGRAIETKLLAVAASLAAVMVAFASTSAFFDQPQYWLPLLLAVSMFPRPTHRQPISSIPSSAARDRDQLT